MLRLVSAAAALLLAATTAAFAHVTLETGEAPVGSGYKAVLRVPHGCDGSPTVRLRVEIPEGFIDAKPMPKPGWSLKLVKGKYAGTYKLWGAEIGEGLKEVDWSGGTLPDDEYDEFVIHGVLASSLSPGTTLHFPVVQECAKGVSRWIEIPAKGADPDSVEHPAPGLKLLPKQ